MCDKEFFTSYQSKFKEHFPNRKEVPSWATGIFSSDVCFVEPENDLHFSYFCMQAIKAYSEYLDLIVSRSPFDYRLVIEAQNKYCEVQASNPRTFSVLKQKLGEERAKYFMEEILFPKIK